MKALIAAAVAVSVAIGVAPPAHCAPELGTDCRSWLINKTATSPDGQTVRCLADPQQGYIWVIDTGKTQDPWVADQMAFAACTKTYPAAQCRDILDGPYSMSP
ncbi:MAG: hypothetical protein JO259_07690 [Mycobacterium sp.]|nr:hypothetical protein [Mycobacterium sp.]